MEMGTKNVQHLLLVESNNILLPPLRIQQGMIKNFAGDTYQIATAFRYIAEKFPGISATKIKEGIPVDSQICMLYKGKQYDRILSGNDKTAMSESRLEATNFLGNNKADNCKTLAEKKLYHKVFKDTFPELSLGYFSRKLWGTQQ